MTHSTPKQRLLIVQRVITPYRFELLEKLLPYFTSIVILSSYGQKMGANTTADTASSTSTITVHRLRSIKLPYRGESRGWSFYLYPQSILHLFKTDIVLLEGTTNLANNIYLVPLARLLRKKIIWWDAGYSPSIRTARRKKIDTFVSKLIHLTHKQIAYSSSAETYMKKYMGARSCSTTLNTISTTYFEKIKGAIKQSIQQHTLDATNIKLLYVGAVEKRKKIIEIIALVNKLNNSSRQFHLTIIGDGDFLERSKAFVKKQNINNIIFTGRIYDKEELKPYYFSSDLFVMPGDGGLALAQALLFGLPVVCVAADGTERDYIDDKSYILNSFDELEDFLLNFTDNYNRKSTLDSMACLQDQHFITSLVNTLTS